MSEDEPLRLPARDDLGRETCPLCGNPSLEWNRILIGWSVAQIDQWCEKCGWSGSFQAPSEELR